MSPILEVSNLNKTFHTQAGAVYALNDIEFTLERGKILGLVGESGSGKTTLGRSILRLIEPTSGSVKFDGQEITTLDRKALRRARQQMQIIFQDPFSSLNPRLKVRALLSEGLIAQGIEGNHKDIVAALLEEVGLSADHMSRYAHEFSGGQRQRLGIARALAVNPEFVVADESVSALDVSVQAQILNLLKDLQEKRNLTMLFIAHDLSVVEHLCDEVMVLYLGRIVEMGDAKSVYANPQHPYTRALLDAAPRPDPKAKSRERIVLKGDIPSPLSPPSGCVFHTRCPLATSACTNTIPALTGDATHRFACPIVAQGGSIATNH